MKRKSWLSIILMTALLCSWAIGGLAQEGVLTLPENLTKIEDEAFAGNTSLDEVVLPEGVETIGSRAFAGSTVSAINLPASITSIADDAFDGCGAMDVSAQEGSYAYDWAVEKGHSILKPATPASSFAYSIANEEVTITAFVGDETEVMIPRSIEGYPVTFIGDSAFKDRSDLTSVSIPDGVTSIGVSAFRNCSSMTSIMIPNGVTSIGTYTFYGCSSLTSIMIPDGVTSIGAYTFYGCSSLTSIELPDSVTSIGGTAFRGCSSLTSIELPDSVTSIGSSAFYGCSSLTSVELPDGVTSIGDWVFNRCSNLMSIKLPDGVTSIGYSAFYGCSSLTSIVLPDSVTSIGGYAFNRCSNLTSINIPDGVTSIGAYTFYRCSSLMNIELPEGVTSIGSSAFEGCSSVTSIELPEGVTSVGDRTFYGCSNLTGINIPDGVTNIGEYAFEGCSSLTNINIPDGVTSIGNSAFYGCRSLTSIELPDSVTSIGSSVFSGCSSLTSINIPDGITSIGKLTFFGCSGLTSIELPDSVTSIGEGAFYGCSSVKSIGLPDGVTSIGSSAFDGCAGLMSINLPDSVTSIGEGAFSDCSSLTSIELPDGVTSIGDHTFSGCSSLTGINIPDGVTSIGEYAFSGCRGLKNINIPDGVTSIGVETFYSCSSLTSIELPDSVTSIGECAFAYCSSLTSINLPASITSIADDAFDGCRATMEVSAQEGSYAYDWAVEKGYLSDSNTTPFRRFNYSIKNEAVTITGFVGEETEVVVPQTIEGYPVTSIGDSAFDGCSSLTSIELPDSVTSIGEYAFRVCRSLTSIELPDSVTSIGDRAFYSCSGLTSIELPNSVTSIGAYTFYFCSSLTSIELPNSVTSIGEWAFKYCSGLTSIELPDGVTSIGEYAFSSCSSLTSIKLPDSLTSIGMQTFSGCSSLTSIELPDGVTSIGDCTFYACSSLMGVYIPDGVTSIGRNAFGYCSSLTSIELPDSVTSIGEYAFDQCSSLTSIELPDSVTSISGYAFADCWSLTSISIPDGVTSIGDRAFSSCSSLISIELPDSVTSIDEYAFYRCSGFTIYGVSGSYAETYAAENSIPFIAGEMPKVFPTLTDFTLNTTLFELTVPMGTELVFGGTISAGSAQLVDVQASVFLASDHEQGAVYEREEDIKADTYDLSRLSPMTVGAEYNGFAMTAGNSYDVMLYVTDGNGNGFESDPYIRVHVVEDGEITWYAEITDEAGNALSSVTLPHTGEYAGRICVRTNNGNMTAWVDEGFPFDFALESVEPQDDGAYVFTYALSAPLILFDEVRTDTVLFCLRDENGVAITDTPLAQLTITQEGNPTPPEIFSITDREGNDLTTTPLTLDYTGACATDVIVHGNYAAITAWFNTVTTIDFGAPVETVLEDGTTQLVFSDVKAGENVTASDIARTCVFYAYTEDANNPDKSKPLGEIQVVQEGNPNIPIVMDVSLTLGDDRFDEEHEIKIIPNIYDESSLYKLEVSVSNAEGKEFLWHAYVEDTDVADIEVDNYGNIKILPKSKTGTTGLYISHIDAADMKEIDSMYLIYVCDIYRMPTREYRAILLSQPMGLNLDTPITPDWKVEDMGEADAGKNSETAMMNVFGECNFNGQSVAISHEYNLSSEVAAKAYLSSDRGIDDSDVTFIYISTHGYSDQNGNSTKSLKVGNGNNGLTHADLADIVINIPGRVILMVDACYSGGIIDSVCAAYAKAGITTTNITIFTSCDATEVCNYSAIPGAANMYFTDAIRAGFYSSKDMDEDGDKRVSVFEFMKYVRNDLLTFQTPCVWPEEALIGDYSILRY